MDIEANSTKLVPPVKSLKIRLKWTSKSEENCEDTLRTIAGPSQEERKEAKDAPLTKDKGKGKTGKTQKTSNKTPMAQDALVSLTQMEIQEDIYALTGRKRAYRPHKKRPKQVQNDLNVLFPGMKLKTITPERYNVADSRK